MKFSVSILCFVLALYATPTLAQFELITSRAEFVAAVNGKTLSRPLVRLRVSPNGMIKGTGAAWDVTGKWQWKGGYFCRSLVWGGDDLPYNCQEIAVDGTRMRITSDRGAGESATFSLR